MKRLVAILLFGVLATNSVNGATCSPQDAQSADAIVDEIHSWKKLDEVFLKFGHCDDGSIAEGNSEAIARLLVDQWQTLPALNTLFKQDRNLKRFVLRHIDTTLDTDDLTKIEKLSSTACPAGMTRFCSELKAAAKRASN